MTYANCEAKQTASVAMDMAKAHMSKGSFIDKYKYSLVIVAEEYPMMMGDCPKSLQFIERCRVSLSSQGICFIVSPSTWL